MRLQFRPAVVAIVSSFFLSGCAPKSVHFGEPVRLADAEPVPVIDVLATPQRYNGMTIRVRGRVAEVCQPKGCWLELSPDNDSARTVFVKFTCPIDGRLIPLEAVGHDAVVEGIVTIEELSQDEARHYAEDAGAPADQIAAIVGPQMHVRMASPSATIYGLEPAPSAPQ